MMSGGNYTHVDSQNVPGSVPAVVPDTTPPHVKFAGTLTYSNLQTFPPSRTQGQISDASKPPRDVDDTFSKSGSRSAYDETPQPSGWLRKFTIATYQPYFDVDTIDVLERIKDSLFPFRGTFTEKTSTNPDLYGPFWICTTLIFVAASIGTFVTYVTNELQKKEWNYDIQIVTWSAGLFYGYSTVIPLGLYIILKYFSAPAGFVQLLCLYGYSLFVFIPALCLSVVPLEIFRWVVAGVAGFMSASFVALNLRAHIMSSGESWVMIVAGIFVLQLALSVVLKLYLFTVTRVAMFMSRNNQVYCVFLIFVISIINSAFHHQVVRARYLREDLGSPIQWNTTTSGNSGDDQGFFATINREVPSGPDPLHNK
ncbi:hypothetical protein ACFE04_027150 [Oxalis oulophora]